jgi:hypothetical protein
MHFEDSRHKEAAEVIRNPRHADHMSSHLQSSMNTTSTKSKTMMMRKELMKSRTVKSMNRRWELSLVFFSIAVIIMKVYFRRLYLDSLQGVFLKYDSVLLLSRLLRPIATYYRDNIKQDLAAFYPFAKPVRDRMNAASLDVQIYYDKRLRKLFAFTAGNYSTFMAPLQIVLPDFPEDLNKCKVGFIQLR